MKTVKAVSDSTAKKLKTTPIAIIGISGIFPQASNKQEYWENILNKIDAVSDVPISRWNSEDYFDPDPKAEDKTYCKRGGFIPDIDFDPAEFGLPPNLLESTDVSQLLSLVAARDCLEDGGYGDEAKHSRENVGVVLGMVGIGSKLVIPLMARLQYPVWNKVLKSYGVSDNDRAEIIEKIKLAYPRWEENSFPGSIGNVVAGRIANRFNLGGTNCVVDAACASSLAAIRMAVGELIEGRADMMITGGVDTDNSIGAYLCFSKTPAFSKGEHVRSFDQDSDGMMVGEGIGMVLLKRLEDAERDGDRIYAVIKAIGTSSDGRFKSIYAPRPDGQSLALQRAYKEAGFDPSTIGLIEAHGTGTMAGDPAEFQGLNKVFSESDNEKQHIALGSVKSQIAHTKAAAGVASLIKVALSIHHKILPATINVNKPNPKLEIENSPFYINTEVRPWFQKNDTPRRAGVSSFGFGGTNFHVVLEEYQADHNTPYRLNSTSRIILLSAPEPDDLSTLVKEWSAKLSSADGAINFAELASTNKTSIPEGHCRLGFNAQEKNEALAKLKTAEEMIRTKGAEESVEHPSGVFYRRQGINPKGKVVALFPGQGSQYLNMGIEVARNFPEVRHVFGAMNALFEKDSEKTLTDRVYPIPVFNDAAREKQNRDLTQTEFAQPAIGTLSSAYYQLLKTAGFKADFSAGHSFGELTALWAAGVFSEEEFFFLARSRGKAMAPLADPNFDAGAMLAVRGDVNSVRKEISAYPEVTLANWNSNSQVVLAGSKPAITGIQKVLTEKGYSVVPLDVSAAFHTSLVSHAQKPFAAALDKVKFKSPEIKVYSNTSGKSYSTDVEIIKKTLSDHILNSVLFRDEIESIYDDGGRIFVEIGPKNVLTNLVNNILESKPHYCIALNPNSRKDSDRQYREALTQLCVLGLNLNPVDHYALEIKPVVREKSSINLKLNGGLYLSEKTRTAFQNAINQKNSFSMPEKEPISPVQPISGSPALIESQEATKMSKSLPFIPDNHLSPPVSDNLNKIQLDILSVHARFLENDAEFTRSFSNLTEQELNLVRGNTSPQTLEQINTALQTLDRSLSHFHQHQIETTRIHEQFLRNQYELASRLMSLGTSTDNSILINQTDQAKKPSSQLSSVVESVPVRQPSSSTMSVDNPAPIVEKQETPVPAMVETKTEHSDLRHELNSMLLSIVSEKTGYPVEMLEVGMDMEADLGIDSIKRVEILGAMQEKFPELPQVDPAVLSDLRTLGQIIEYMFEKSGHIEAAIPEPKPTNQIKPLAETQFVSSGNAPSTSLEEVSQVLLSIVSEKTGYPVEMLELGMDMEADLGIDSIKRVEILGAMQERFPELPSVDPSQLSDMRTMGQIITHMSISGNSQTEQLPDTPSLSQQISEHTSIEVIESSTVSFDELSQVLIEIVSEKTGYPAEMLETDMDMEADLGIDSIKRVEILGAMQEKFPQLPTAEASQLSELHTLQQIIDMLAGVDASVKNRTPSEIPESPHNLSPANELSKGYVRLKNIPYPDRLDIKLPDGSLAIVTDDGTDLTTDVSQCLIDDGQKVVVLHLSGVSKGTRHALPSSVKEIDLVDNSESTLTSAIADINSQFGKVRAFIHLDPRHFQSSTSSVEEESIVRSIFLLAKLLKEDLTSTAKNSFAAFLTVTHLDGQFGTSMSEQVEPVSGGLFGLTKTLSLEWDDVYCRAIDIKPGLGGENSAEIIINELFDPNRLVTEVGYTESGRFTMVVEQTEPAGAE